MSGPNEKINEVYQFVEKLSGYKAENLDELAAELNRLIEASKKPGYSPEQAALLLRQRNLVIEAAQTARNIMKQATQLEKTPAPTVHTPEIPQAQSASAPTIKTPKLASDTPEPATGTPLQRFMSNAKSMASDGYERLKDFIDWAKKGIVDFVSYAGASITTLWNNWFGKKETTTNESAPPVTDEAQPESVNFMDGQPHKIAGHQVLWAGSQDHFFSIDGRKFSISVSDYVFSKGLKSITQKGDTIVIDSIVGIMELNPVQVNAVINQAINTSPLTKKNTYFSAEYKYIPVNIEFTSLSGEGAAQTRTPGSRNLEFRTK